MGTDGGSERDDEVVGGGGVAQPAMMPRRGSPEGDETGAENGAVGAGSAALLPEGEAGTELTVLPAVPHAEDAQAVKQPTHSTRGTTPGLRGCWALNKAGEPCGAARRADGDYCNAHSGYGVAEDPARWAAVGAARNNEIRRRRATLRLALGETRLNTPRGILRQAVFAQSLAVAEAAMSPITDSAASSMQRHQAAMKLIEVVEPTAQVTVSAPLPDNPEGVDGLSLSALLSLAEAHGLSTATPLTAPDQP